MNFYITTTLPYVNAKPHIGFALELVQADAVARFHRSIGDIVFFNTGTDEHGQKVYAKAREEGKDPQLYVDEYAAKFLPLKNALNLSYNAFIRTTDPQHKAAAQEFWRRCATSGDIYKKLYQVKYCVGCELEKTDSELADGKCLLHPNLDIELIDEENYFFRLSKYQDRLLTLYKSTDFLVPQARINEMISLIERERLQDFSISRLKAKMPWGVPVPGDDAHVMYVWFDALVNYISTLGWPDDETRFKAFWPGVQFAGKDQVRQQAAMWQAMLFSAGLPNTKQIFIHGFVTTNGQKMSKSLGNVIDPLEFSKKYGTDAVRYFLLRHINPMEDGDITDELLKETYNANLANGLGNLVSRVMKLAEDNLSEPVVVKEITSEKITRAIHSFEFNRAMDYIWNRIAKLDERMSIEEPYRLVKTDPEKGKRIITEITQEVGEIAVLLAPFIPETSEKIIRAIKTNRKPETLFPRHT